MHVPEVPHNEDARLAALHGLNILDTPAEDRFDRYTRLSRRIFDMPIATISLVDRYRQWFKSKDGISVEETPRDISFCGHAILGDDIFEIRNARRDPRFRDNPLVIELPHIRFYAGAPLISPDGYKLGTLCIIDRVPRWLGDEDKALLRDLADMVIGEMTNYIDTGSGLMNRTGLRSLGAKTLAAADPDQSLELVLLDISHLRGSSNASMAERSPITVFSQMLTENFPRAKVIAHMGGGNFCVLVDQHEVVDEIAIVRHLCARASELLAADDAEDFLPVFVGSIRCGESTHSSIDEIIREADALFFQRAQQPVHGTAARTSS